MFAFSLHKWILSTIRHRIVVLCMIVLERRVVFLPVRHQPWMSRSITTGRLLLASFIHYLTAWLQALLTLTLTHVQLDIQEVNENA